MLQSTKPKKRQASYLIFLFLRPLFLSRGVSVLEFSYANPLFVIMLGALCVVRWDWKFLVVVMLSSLCSSSLGMLIMACTHTQHVLRQLEEFVVKIGSRKLLPISVSDYLQAVDETSSARVVKEPPRLVESALSSAEYFVPEYIRFVVIEQERNLGIAGLTTFMIWDRAWIFLDSHPQGMKASKRFTLLHEVGHTELFGLMGYGVKIGSKVLILSLPFMVLMLTWNAATLITLAVLFITQIWIRSSTARFQKEHGRFLDELSADVFAFDHCPRDWFQHYSEKNIETFANYLSQNLPLTTEYRNSISELDPPPTDEQIEWRRLTLLHNLKRLLVGEPPVTDDTVPLAPARQYQRRRLVQLVVMIGLLIGLGFQHAELTTMRFLGLVAIMALTVFTALCISQFQTAKADYLDIELGFNKDLSRGTRSNVNAYVQWRTLLRQFEGLRENRIDKQHLQLSAHGNDTNRNFIPPGITGTLFLPDELDLFANTVSGDAYIFHGKVIDYEISHLEYYSENHSVVVVMKDKTRRDLGVKLQSLVRPYFLHAKEINIVRTKDKKAVAGIKVPFRKVT